MAINIQELYSLAAKQRGRDKWLIALIAHYRAKIEIYKLMIEEWEDELRSLDDG